RGVELACHPGYWDPTLIGRDCPAPDDQFYRRVNELNLLRQASFVEVCREAGFRRTAPPELRTLPVPRAASPRRTLPGEESDMSSVPAIVWPSKWERRGVIVLGVLVVLFGVLVEIRSAFLKRHMGDLGVYLRAAWAVRTGVDPYQVTDNDWHYCY